MLEFGMGLALILAIFSWIIGLKELKTTANIKILKRVALTYHHAIIIMFILTMLNILFG